MIVWADHSWPTCRRNCKTSYGPQLPKQQGTECSMPRRRKTDYACLETLMHRTSSRFDPDSGKTGQPTIAHYPAQKTTFTFIYVFLPFVEVMLLNKSFMVVGITRCSQGTG